MPMLITEKPNYACIYLKIITLDTHTLLVFTWNVNIDIQSSLFLTWKKSFCSAWLEKKAPAQGVVLILQILQRTKHKYWKAMTSTKLTLTRVPNWKWLGSVNSANSERRNLRKKGSQGGIAVVTLIGTTCIFSLWSSQGNGAITITMNVLVNHLIYHPPVPLSTNRRNISIRIILERQRDKERKYR